MARWRRLLTELIPHEVMDIMATEFPKLTRCAGGAHWNYTAIVDGKTLSGTVQVDDQERPKPVTVQDAVEAAVLTAAKSHKTLTARKTDPKVAADAVKAALAKAVVAEPVAEEGVR